MIAGIDNGLGGGIAILSNEGEILALYRMPKGTGPRGKGADANVVDARAFSSIIGDFPDATEIAIERPAGSQDVNAVQSMADSFATCRTVILCRGRKLHAPHPKEWQRTFWVPPKPAKKGEQREKFDTKAAALAAAAKLWPGRDFIATDRSSKAHDGLVDAALIAEWLRRKLFAPHLLRAESQPSLF
jgi:hypothetical protein